MKLKQAINRKSIVTIAFIILLCIFQFSYLTSIPSSAFCDEVNIVSTANQVAQGNFSNIKDFFFYNQFEYLMFSFVVYPIVPFFLIFGQSLFTLRLASGVYSILSMIMILLIFRELKWKNRLLSISVFFFTAMYFHVSRVGFGHIQTYFLSLVGLYFFISSSKKFKIYKAIFAGIFLGLSLYGQQSFTVAVPILVGACGFVFLVKSILGKTKKAKNYRTILFTILTFLIMTIPLFYENQTNPKFIQRFIDKSAGSETASLQSKAAYMLKNYPKYYSIDYLVNKGENGMPGAFITRHSISDIGIINPLIILLAVCSLANLYFRKDSAYSWLGLLLLVLYPLPDLITTKDTYPPYTFSASLLLYALPFLIGSCLNLISHIQYKFIRAGIVLVVLILLAINTSNLWTKFIAYPQKSSDYWGYQEGMQQIINYAKNRSDGYDQIVITGYFNQADALFNFYNNDNKCSKCKIGSIGDYKPDMKQLFIIRKGELDSIDKDFPKHTFSLVDTISISSPNDLFVSLEVVDKKE